MDSGLAFRSIGAARSAVSLMTSNEIGNNSVISRFIRGVGKIRPPRARYSSTWDPMIVLKYLGSLEPIENLSLKELTLKTVGLLAICTGHRVQTIHNIKLSDIILSEDRVQIDVSCSIKTSKPGKEQPCLVLPKFLDHPEWCAFRAIKCYMEKTESIRKGIERLLISFGNVKNDCTKQTVSRWIKLVLANSGIDVNKFGAHSTRHASTSAAARAGISIDQIRSRAGWSSSSYTFSRFYNRPLDTRDQFALSVCGSNK